MRAWLSNSWSRQWSKLRQPAGNLLSVLDLQAQVLGRPVGHGRVVEQRRVVVGEHLVDRVTGGVEPEVLMCLDQGVRCQKSGLGR
jgi:hypothetical protein